MLPERQIELILVHEDASRAVMARFALIIWTGLPGATGLLPWLTPVAATFLAILMAIAAVFHLQRSGEGSNVVNNVVLLVIATLVAYGRFVVSPF